MTKIIFLLSILWLGVFPLPLIASQTDHHLPILDFLSGLLNKPKFPQSDLYSTNDDLVIKMNDGVELQANIFIPNNLNGLGPAIIFINSWGLNEYQYLTQAGELAEKGYIVLSYSTRGFGTSSGQINAAGPLDTSDYSAVIDYLLSHYPVNPDAIATAGISYGSGISLLGAAQDNRVKAVAAMSSWGDLAHALYGNNSPRLVWAELLVATGKLAGNPEPIIAEHWQAVKHQNLEKITEVKAWAQERSPIHVVDQLNENGTAVYLAKAYDDNLFQPNTLLDFFGQLTTPKYMDLVPGTHASAEMLPSLTGIGEDIIWKNVYQWFDTHLQGKDTDISQRQPLQMKIKFQDRFEGFDNYPIAGIQKQPFYLHPRGLFHHGGLEPQPYKKKGWFDVDNTINAWTGTLFSTQIPLLSQLLEQLNVPVMAPIHQASDYRSIYFATSPLEDTMKIRGHPELSLHIEPHSDTVQLVVYLYDMDRYGIGTLITHGVMTLPEALRGEKVVTTFDLISTAYDIPAGHQLALAIDTKDPLYKTPTEANYFLDFEFSDKTQSILTVPTL